MDKFETWLNMRAVPEHRSNLSHRIIAAAMAQSQVNDLSFWERVSLNFVNMFALPRPAYAFAAILLLSLALGLQVEMSTSLDVGYAYSAFTNEITASDYIWGEG